MVRSAIKGTKNRQAKVKNDRVWDAWERGVCIPIKQGPGSGTNAVSVSA